MSSSSSPEHEVHVVPPVANKPDAQTTGECPISAVPISTKEEQGTSQVLERIDCPISSVQITEKIKTQSNSEEGQQLSVTEAEKNNTSQSKEGKTDAKIGTTSGKEIGGNQNSRQYETREKKRQKER